MFRAEIFCWLLQANFPLGLKFEMTQKTGGVIVVATVKYSQIFGDMQVFSHDQQAATKIFSCSIHRFCVNFFKSKEQT